MKTESSTPTTAKPEKERPKLNLRYGGAPTSSRPLPKTGGRE